MIDRATPVFRWLWSPIAALWAEIKGLRTEEIRSVAVVAGVVILFRGFERMQAGDSLLAPFVVVTLICLMMTAGLAWQATYIKGQIAGVRMQLGRRPDPSDRMFREDMTPERAAVPDDPDQGAN